MSKHPAIIPLILEQVAKEVEDEWRPPRLQRSFRGSELGDCSRAIQYAALGVKQEPIGPELALLFADGNLHHDALRSQLRKIGTVTNVEHPSFKVYQVGYKDKNFSITLTTTCDLHFAGRYVGELKSISTFSFKGLSEEVVKDKYEHYYWQLQTYLDVYDKEEGFILFKDKNSSALKIFWFKRDPAILQVILQKLAKIQYLIENKKMITRPFKKSSWDCKTCPFRMKCWGKPREGMRWR